MARIIKANGEITEVSPANGKDFKLEELQTIVDGYIEVIWMPEDKIMVINEEGKLLKLPVNEKATKIYQDNFCYPDIIVGDVLVCDANQVE